MRELNAQKPDSKIGEPRSFSLAVQILASLAIEDIYLSKSTLEITLRQGFALTEKQVSFLVSIFAKNGDGKRS